MDAHGIARGIEVLIKKAAVDAEFRRVLLDKRAEAAGAIDLALDPAEAAMLDGIPASQLEAIVSATKVDAKLRPALLGKAAAVMIAALGAGSVGCEPTTMGVRSDRIPKVELTAEQDTSTTEAPRLNSGGGRSRRSEVQHDGARARQRHSHG